MKTCKQKALEWGISERTVNDLCKKGRIPGAVKNGRRWQIPDEAIKPEDGRISSGRYVRARGQEKLRSLPIGISDYARAQSEYYYVDKTLLIKEFLDKKPMVSLFTRPRRFGKTLNMDMLRCFFEISEEEQLTVLYILPILVACTQYGCINPCAAMMYEQGEAQNVAEKRMGDYTVMVFALDIVW